MSAPRRSGAPSPAPSPGTDPDTATTPYDAVCVGETMALLIPEGHGPDGSGADDAPAPSRYRAEAAGAESNVAVHLARAGRRTAWCSALGDDPFGQRVREQLTASGVHCATRTDPDRPTGLYLKRPDPRGTRVRYWRHGSAASALTRDDAARVWRLRPRLVHTSGITAALSDSTDGLVEELLAAAPAATLRGFDVNYRPALHGAGHADRLLDLARRADVVFCGLDEAQALWRVDTVEQARALLHGPELVVVKQGAEGATAFHGDRSWFRPAPRVEVVEPVGAGDAFAAGFLDRMLDEAPISDCLAEGARLAGIVLGLHGDIPPPRPDDHRPRETGPTPVPDV